MILAKRMTAGHPVRCGECDTAIQPGDEFAWDRSLGTTCLNCAKENDMQAEITINDQTLQGMAMCVEAAEATGPVMAVIQKYQDATGVIPALAVGMSYDEALAVLRDTIQEENAQRPDTEEILVVEPAKEPEHAYEPKVCPRESVHDLGPCNACGYDPDAKPTGGAIVSEKDERDILEDFDW